MRLLERWSGPGTTFVLALLCVVLAAGVAIGVWWDGQEAGDRATTQAPITSVEARDVLLEGAGPLTEQVLSYSWEGYDDRLAATRQLVGGGFAASYDAQMAELRDGVVADRVTVRTTATDVGVVSATSEQAVALVFLDQVSSTQGAAGERRDQVRVLVTLAPVQQEWRVVRLDSF